MEEEKSERLKPLRFKPGTNEPSGVFPSEEQMKVLQEKAEKRISLLMVECPNPDEWAAKHGAGMIMFYPDRYEYRDPAVREWARRAREVTFDDELLTIAEDRYLTGEELEQAKLKRESGTRHE